MNRRALWPVLTLMLFGVPSATKAQSLPTTQPTILTIYREEIKYGHSSEHETTEAGWPAAYAKAKSPYTYLAISSITGPGEVWFLAPYADYKAMGDAMKQDQADPLLAAELARLAKADAEHVGNARAVHLIGRPDLSNGAYPDIAKARFFEVTIFRVRSGHESEFEDLAKVFKAAYQRAAPELSYRMYQVTAGMPGPTYMVFSSFPVMSELDKNAMNEVTVMRSLSADEQRALATFSREGMINSETQRFAVNGRMSYVDDATVRQDPNFWRPGVKASK
jgi:hypothetical protein